MLAIVLGLIGSALLGFGVPLARRAQASRHWPEVAGKIVAIGMSRIWIGRGTLYFPDIRYEYTVHAASLTGTRIGWLSTLPGFSHGAAIYALQRTYPRGMQVLVRYNPADPRDSVLEPGIRRGLRTVLGSAVLLIMLALAAVVAARMLETPPN
ncbi:MAG: DUF3592 domain-containing protein [Gemmatimonadota bacterium]